MTTASTQTVFQRAQAAIQAAKSGYTKHVEANRSDHADNLKLVADIRGNVSPQGMAKANIALAEKNQAFANTAPYRTMNAAVDDVRTRADQAKARLAKVCSDLSPDGDTAAELRATRYWNRTKGVLDSLTGSHSTHAVRLRIEKAIADAKPAELGTLLQEVEGYCESRQIDPAGWLDHALAIKVPDYVQAKNDVGITGVALSVVEATAARLRSAVESGHNAAALTVDIPDKYDPDL